MIPPHEHLKGPTDRIQRDIAMALAALAEDEAALEEGKLVHQGTSAAEVRKKRKKRIRGIERATLPVFSRCPRVDLCVKAWVLPNCEIRVLDDRHADWLIRHQTLEAGPRLVDLPSHLTSSDETEIRLLALRAGLMRLNYRIRGGGLTLEANRTFSLDVACQVVDGLLAMNADHIDSIRVNMLLDDGVVWRTADVNLRGGNVGPDQVGGVLRARLREE